MERAVYAVWGQTERIGTRCLYCNQQKGSADEAAQRRVPHQQLFEVVKSQAATVGLSYDGKDVH